MIALVEGAKRQKTPNEIALTILLSALTFIFLLVCVTLKPFGIYSGTVFSVPVLIALLVCLIPTTIGGLLSAIGIAGMDRLLQRNVLAMSGRAVEAAGDVDVLLLDKTGTITLGNRMATAFHPAPGVSRNDWPTPRNSLRSPTKRPKAAASSCWPRKNSDLRAREMHEPHAHFVPFTAQTRMSGVDFHANGASRRSQHPQRRGGSRSAAFVESNGRHVSRKPVSKTVEEHFPSRRHAAGRCADDRRSSASIAAQRHRQRRDQGTFRPSAQDGHPHRHDHRRQPAHRRRHRGGSGRG